MALPIVDCNNTDDYADNDKCGINIEEWWYWLLYADDDEMENTTEMADDDDVDEVYHECRG